MDPQMTLILVLFVLGLLLIVMGVQRVRDGHARVVERLGRRHKVLKPGIGFIIPFFDRIKKDGLNISTKRDNQEIPLVDRKGNIAMAETRMDPPSKLMIAKDNSEVNVDVIGFFRIVDPAKTVYDVDYVGNSLESLMETTLRQEVGKLDSDTLIASRDILSESLRSNITEAAVSWGIQVTRVEIENISFTDDIQEKLSAQRQEELIRRGEVVEAQAVRDKEILMAEGEKKSQILRSEGIRESQILEAEGRKQEEILIAQGNFERAKLEAEGEFLRQSREKEGMAQGFAAINKALEERPEAVVALQTLEAQKSVADSIGQSDNALILPAETAGLFGAIGSITKGLAALSESGLGQARKGGKSTSLTEEGPISDDLDPDDLDPDDLDPDDLGRD